MSLPSNAVIDVHAHVWDAIPRIVPNPVRAMRGAEYASEVDRRLAGTTNPDELDRRIAALDAAGIDLQVLSFTYPHSNHTVDADYVRQVNTLLAEFVDRAPDRLRGFAKVDLRDVDGAINELKRAVQNLGLIGVYLTTDFQIDDPRLEPFYAAVEQLDVPMFLHGIMPTQSLIQDPRLAYEPGVNGDALTGRYQLGAPFGFVYEESLAALTLILSGVLDRYPRLNVCVTHGGGALAYVAPRVSASLWSHEGGPEHVRDPKEFQKRLHRLWVDCDVQSARNLQLVLDVLNPEHVVLGTDFPSWAPHPLHLLSPAQRIELSRNARALLKLDVPAPALAR